MDPHDLAPGDRVALLVPGSVAYAELVIALLRRGVFPVPMDVKLTASEREALLADLEPALVVTTQEQLEELLDCRRPTTRRWAHRWVGRST